jgi:glycosyltransferase involved in cell wall biosynthesis
VVEALSQGLPVVATRMSALPEIVEDGIHGRLVPPEDPVALAAALTSLVDGAATRRRLGAAGIRRVAQGWDLQEAVTRLYALLLPLLGESTTTAPAPLGVGSCV